MPEIPVFATPFGDLFQGYGWENRSISELSTTSAFDTGIDNRDKFFGRRRCVVCGHSAVLEHSHIIPLAESDTTWVDLKNRRWVPSAAKSGQHEPRNGLLMCPTHQKLFDTFFFFIRYIPQSRRFVLVNQSNHYDLEQYHGKCVPLNISDPHTPFPSVFIIHEMRVRGFHPFQAAVPINTDTTIWQDWITTDAVYNPTTEWFEHKPAPSQDPASTPAPALVSGVNQMQMGDAAINAILQATRDSASWRACELEDKTWTGTAEENTRAYLASKDH
ncbi:hypothetical protein B0H13DRAFT_1703331 [Mycena leptocephala]|nr:hypothetical protein B0H13DRAFT_1703331 [Mycena leptocephala]